MPTPANPELYAQAKRIADETYKKPSAYKSGFIVKKYKELGGKYRDDKKPKNLKNWFREDWKDVVTHTMPDGTVMAGATHGPSSYPVFRPTKRVNKKTPLTVSEIDPVNLRKQIKLKQKIRGSANLPPFEPKTPYV